MANRRVKGLNTEVLMAGPNGLYENITAIRDHELEFIVDVIQEGYLGEASSRRDDIFDGVRGNFTVHIEDPEVFKFVRSLIARSRSQYPDNSVSFAIETHVKFSDTSVEIIRIPNVHFTNVPVSMSGRKDYVTMRLSYESGDFGVENFTKR